MTDLIEAHAPIHGGSIPDDHRYLLHAALKQTCCVRLTERGWQVRAIQGGRVTDGVRILEGTDAHLSLRLPRSDTDALEALCDTPLRLGDHIVLVDEPTIQPIRPHSNLVSDCVYQKHTERGPRGLNGKNTGAQVGKVLGAELGHTDFGIDVQEHVTLSVTGTTLHGNRVRVMGLSDEESQWVQRHGVCQKQSWGCGTFWAE